MCFTVAKVMDAELRIRVSHFFTRTSYLLNFISNILSFKKLIKRCT